MANQPTKYKKFVATAATATLVASAIVPVASAATPSFSDIAGNDHENNIRELAELGFIGGYPDGTFKPGNSVTRGQVALMLGKWAQAQGVKVPADYATTEYFNDLPASATEDNKKMYALVKAAGIFGGYSDGSLKPNQKISRQQMAIVLNSAYKAVNGTSLVELAGDISNINVADISKVNPDYRDEVKALKALGITKPVNFNPAGDVTRGQFASFLNTTIKVEVKAETSVKSVKAINAKTIEVEFNNAIDKETLKNESNQDIITVVASENAANAGKVSQELSEDGKTLTLKAQNIFKGEYTVKVPFEIIKDLKGNFVSPINSKITVDDQNAPVLTEATSKIKDTKDTIKSITLTFDEEVTSIDTVKINGTNYSAIVNGNKATVTVKLDATKPYEVTVVNARDAAGNIKDVQVAPLVLSMDNVAPSIVNVETVGENQVKVTVDEELAEALDVTAKVGTFTTNIVTKVEKNIENNKEYTVTLNKDYLFKNGNSDTVTLTFAKEELVDALGNKNADEITKKAVVSKDATAPKVVKVDTTKTEGKVSSFAVTYDEEVKNPTIADVKVVNSKGEILTTSKVVSKLEVKSDDAKTVVFTLASSLATDKYSFELAEGFVVDKALNPNESAKYSFSVDVTEDGQPVETSFNIAGVIAEAGNVINVDFGAKVKATGAGSALNPSAYQLNGITLPTNTSIEFAKDQTGAFIQTKVVITLPAGFVEFDDDKAIFRVNAVQTLDNKVSNQFSKLIAVTDNTAPVAQSFVATDLTKITVTYTEAIEVVDTNTNGLLDEVSDEISLFDNKGAAIEITAVEVKEGKLVLTVEDATQVASIVTLETKTANITDENGVAQKAKVTVKKQ